MPLPAGRSFNGGLPGAAGGHPGVDHGQLVEAWAEFLQPARFDWFTTHTFKRRVGPNATNRAWADWTRWLRHKQGYRAEWFRVTELTRAGAIHLHALVGHVSTLRRLSALDYWRSQYGFCQVLPFDPQLGARYYLSKYVSKDAAGELLCDFSRRFKRLLGEVRPSERPGLHP